MSIMTIMTIMTIMSIVTIMSICCFTPVPPPRFPVVLAVTVRLAAVQHRLALESPRRATPIGAARHRRFREWLTRIACALLL